VIAQKYANRVTATFHLERLLAASRAHPCCISPRGAAAPADACLGGGRRTRRSARDSVGVQLGSGALSPAGLVRHRLRTGLTADRAGGRLGGPARRVERLALRLLPPRKRRGEPSDGGPRNHEALCLAGGGPRDPRRHARTDPERIPARPRRHFRAARQFARRPSSPLVADDGRRGWPGCTASGCACSGPGVRNRTKARSALSSSR
jgi:hypothetical protein